ncbi:sigma-70 family RNA polymerase sigma factor [Patulibacter sp.]|uniref:sigma-70 family RNA polymerase sigma factor n=1 Tax=Patulibacter sp. TaxID=1912859 RepID=UPI002716A261|nr:sigma-70 family RNA polymerase sigma factor [Patulibacter sp.]MDO9409777.1 sigma-70 family RNA polymerase sigma factor [Patulibacter sp.]
MPDSTTRREQLDMQLLRRYHHHDDRSARAEMVERGMPLVRSLARPYAGRGEELDDLVQVGSVGLVKAIDRFDPDSGYRFVAFAAPNITGEIKRHFRDHCWAIHVPRSVQELDARINRESGEIHSRTGRAATVAELSARLKVPTERVADAMIGGQGYRSLSLDHPAGETREALDLFGRSDAGYAAVDRHEEILDACSALDDREREMVLLRYYDGQLQREIAGRFGISQMQVSRILGGALEKMHDHIAGVEGAGAVDAPMQLAA